MLGKGETISVESKVVNSVNYFFEIAKRSLSIKTNKYSHWNYGLKYPVEISNNKFEQHPNIDLISKNIIDNESFISLDNRA